MMNTTQLICVTYESKFSFSETNDSESNFAEFKNITNLVPETDRITRIQEICDLVNAVILLTVAPAIMFGNGLVIISVAKFKRLQTKMNMLLVSLAVADSLVAVPTVPVYVLFYMHISLVENAKYACMVKCGSVLISLSGSIMSLTAVTVDRYVAVVYPLYYTSWMTKLRIMKLILIIWIYNIAISVMPSIGVNVWRDGIICDFFTVLPMPFTIFTVPIILFTCLLASSCMYIQIFREANRNKKRVEKLSLRDKATRETRAAKVMFLIFFLFFLFWFPFLICSLLKYIPTSRVVIEIIKNFTLTLAMCNSAVNPIIYCWLRSDFRAAFKAIIHCKSELKPSTNGQESF